MPGISGGSRRAVTRDTSGPGIAAISAGLTGAFVPVNGTYAATTTDVFTSKVTGDATNRFARNADGSTESGDGVSALVLSSFTRSGSTAFGRSAGAADVNATPTYLTAFGASAGAANTTGTENSAFGRNALAANTTGLRNTAFGTSALAANNGAGGGNSAFGALAMFTNGTALGSSAFGAITMYASTGAYNSAFGYAALYAPAANASNATTSGARNTALGTETGQASVTQRNDIVAIGYRALVDGNNAIAIGSGASAGAAGAVAIGKDSANTSATTTVADEIKLGTAVHTVNIIGGAAISGTTATLLGFHGTAASAQRAGAAQAAAATTGATLAGYGYTTAAQADAIVTLVNEIRAALVAKGLIKGAA